MIGGADGAPQVFQIHRTTERKIGDNANLIRALAPLTGRINDVAVSPDARYIVSGSSLDGQSQLAIDAWDFSGTPSPEIHAIMAKPVSDRTAEETAALTAFRTQEVKRHALVTVDDMVIHCVNVEPNGKFVVAAGTGGELIFIDPETGSILSRVNAFPGTEAQSVSTLDMVSVDGDHPPTGDAPPDFIRDVAPVLSRMGCNAGTCHGALKGKNGFKLSLRGYDAIFDVRALADDLKGRRINMAAPERSLMLRKIAGDVPHVGGVLTKPGEKYYQIVRDWIANGAQLDTKTPRVTSIEVLPHNPTVDEIGQSMPFSVVATYADGLTRDVTREAFVVSGNTEVASVDNDANSGVPTGHALRRGESPFLARYEGAYAATTLTVMGDRDGFVWQPPTTWSRIDELVATKWERMKIEPSELCTDEEFLRRVYLDLVGLPPTRNQLEAFLADGRDTRQKRQEVIDSLIGKPEYVEYWSNKWADLLQVNSKFLGQEGASALREWIREEVRQNTPHDVLARKILTASGSNQKNPAASYYKILRDPAATLENTTHLFLGVRFNCNKCHDHPFERWTQDQYFQTAAFFANVALEKDPASGDKTVGGTDVEGAKPLYEIIKDDPAGSIKHDRTGAIAEPIFPYETKFEAPDTATRRERFAAWLTSPDNRYFARSWANRIWGYMLGVGLIEPIDDIRAGNPPTNPELLDYLTEEFIKSGFDTQHLVRLIASSRTYQLAISTNQFNKDDAINFSHASPRRLPAEVIFDAVHVVTGTPSEIPGQPPGTRAVSLADASTQLPSGFLATLGRPVRESVCECERSSELQLGPVMALISGETLAHAISSDDSEITRLVNTLPDDEALVDALTMRVLSRHAKPEELAAYRENLMQIDADHAMLTAAVAERDAELATERPKLEADRKARIAQVESDLAARRAAVLAVHERLSKEREAKIAVAEEAVNTVRTQLRGESEKWFGERGTAAIWTIARPQFATGGEGTLLTTEADGSIFVQGGPEKDEYVLTFDVGLSSITAIRLEALTDSRLPAGGPGLAQNGNFVLNEFSVEAASLATPDQFTAIKLKDPLADFSQDNYAIAGAIDGNRDGNQGWAVSARFGQTHWATFQLDAPMAHESGVRLRIKLPQQFGTHHRLGHFRVAVTGVARPVGLSLSEELFTVASTPAERRTPEQLATLDRVMSSNSDALAQAEKMLADAKIPLARDAEEVSLETLLAEVSKPIPDDATLIQLRADLAASLGQTEHRRRTAAQDYVWAMMNSPGFLFNH